MALVCLSHFVTTYGRTSGDSLDALYILTLMSAPTFMIVSGTLLGYFHVTRRTEFSRVVHSFTGRAIFMLTVGRVFICIGNIAWSGGAWESLKYVYITDTVALNMLIGPRLIGSVPPRMRAVLSLAFVAVTWNAVLWWNPGTPALELLKESVFGDFQYSYFHKLHYAFPLLPWFSLYFVSTCLGEKLGRLRQSKGDLEWQFYFIKWGVASIGAALGIKVVYWLTKPHLGIATDDLTLYHLTGVGQKSPPSIVYFMSYGGAAVLMIVAVARLGDARWLAALRRWAGILGRSSLFVFVLQYYVYFTAFYLLHLRRSVLWPLYFVASLAFLVATARAWELAGLNRWMTISPWLGVGSAREPGAGDRAKSR
jgi:hypothetical protein